MEEISGVMFMLTKTNYTIWKRRMEDLLYRKDLMDPILTKGVKPTTLTDDEWTKMNRKTVAHIREWIGDTAFLRFSHEKNAYGLWTSLEKMYGWELIQLQVSRMKELMNRKFVEGTPIRSHARDFMELAHRVRKSGVCLDEETEALLLFCSLPSYCEELIKFAPEGDCSLSSVLNVLESLQEYEAISPASSVEDLDVD